MLRKFMACLSIITVFIALMTPSTIHGQGIEWQCPEIIQRDKIAKPSEALYFILSYADGRNELWYSDGTVLYSKVYEFRFSGEANSVYAKISPDKSKLALTLVKTDGDPRFIEGNVEVKIVSLDNFETQSFQFTVDRNFIAMPNNRSPYSLFWGWADNAILAYNLNTFRLTLNLETSQSSRINWNEMPQSGDERRLTEPGAGNFIFYEKSTIDQGINEVHPFDVLSKQFAQTGFNRLIISQFLSFSDDGQRLAIQNSRTSLQLIDFSTNASRIVTTNGWSEYNLAGYLNPSVNLLAVAWHSSFGLSNDGRLYAITLSVDPQENLATLKLLCLSGFMNYYAGFPSWLGDEYYQFLMNIDDKPQWYIYHAPTHTLTDVMPSELLQEFREANTRLTVAGWGQFPVK